MSFRPWWFPVLLLVAGGIPAAAQTTGQIEGLVRDPDGRVVPGVALRIVESRTEAGRGLESDERGWYLAPGLAPGSYRIELSHPGFRSEKREGVELSAGQQLRVDLRLQLGEARESVSVVAEAQLVSPAPGDWGGSIAGAKLDSLPLNGRDIFDLVSQQPGAVMSTTSQRSLTTGAGIRVSVNGARPNQNAFRMDNIYIDDATSSAPASAGGRLLGLESIEELHLVSSPFDAEYGRAAGAVLTAVSKAGSNQFHGSAYEYLRNSALDAKNFFDPANEKTPPLRRNQFGGLLDGPIRTDRLFFLANYEGLRETSSRTMYTVSPNAAARQGILPDGRVTVAPQVVPYLNLYPLPNGRDYGDGTGEYITAGVTRSHENFASGRLDYVRSSRLRHWARYTFDDALTTRPDPLQVFTFLDTSRFHFVSTETQFLQTPHTIHAFRAGFSRVANTQDSSQSASVPASMSFVPGQSVGSMTFSAGLSNFGSTSKNSVTLIPRRFIVNDFQFHYVLSHVRGRHALRAGGGFDRVQFNQRSDNSTKGVYTFESLSAFLQGAPRSADLAMPGTDTTRGWRQNVYSAFVQDELRLTPRLGVSAGLRYEAYSTPTEVNGKVATLRDPLHDVSTHVGGPTFENPSKTNFAPRAALAFDPFGTGTTVIRAGAGIFFDLISSRELVVGGVRTPPFYNVVTLTRPPFPNLFQAAQNATPVNSLDILDYSLQQPYVAQFQVMVQRNLAHDTVVQIGYAGSRGVHLIGTVGEINPNRPQILADGQLFFPATVVRLNPAFGRIRARRTQFDSSYHGLQAGLQRRWRSGLGVQFKYSWSKSLDNMSTAILGDFLNFSNLPTMFNYSQNRGRSDFDVRQALSASFSYALPRWKEARAAGALLGGWELQGVLQVQTGPAFSPTVGFDRARIGVGGTGDGSQRPSYEAAPGATVVLGDPQRWFDSSVFALPPAGMYGNLGRNTIDGPGLATVDLALHKILWKTDRQSVRLRVETFNIANHPNFQIPSSMAVFDSTLRRVGSAGRITDTTTTSRQIQLALRWAF